MTSTDNYCHPNPTPCHARDATLPKPRVLAIASRGGHWIELLRLREAWQDADVTYVTTDADYRSMVPGARFRLVTEANRDSKLKLVLLMFQVLWLLLRLRPTAIVTTGAAPGYFAIRLGRLLRIRTMWVDSIANAEELSLSGQLASRYADVTLTQWSHLAAEGTIQYRGAVI